mgnify:CR=1 FL=1
MTQSVTDSSRMPLIDAMRALCCLLIVAHHLALYGPMPDMAYPLMPAFMDWLREHARIAVQMFLVHCLSSLHLDDKLLVLVF